MKSWAIILFFGSVLLLAAGAHAAEDLVCFPSKEAHEMLVPLEQAPIHRARLAEMERETAAREKENDLLRQNNALLKEQIGQYKELLQLQKETYEGIVKASKPNIFQQIMDKVGAVGIGVLLGAALVL